MSSNEYFAAQEAEKTASHILSKANAWYNQLYTNGYLAKVKEMWMAYHGVYYNNNDGHRISFSGEQGELVQISINHIRNIADHMHRMITNNRPSFQTRATNTDSVSLEQTRLANDLLTYYMREKRMEKYLNRAVIYSIVLGSGFIKMNWNATSGEVYDFNEETNNYIYEGDVEFTNLSPYDVVFDTTKETPDNHEWVICRSAKNKFDLAAKFPEFKDKIVNLKTKSDLMKFRFDMFSYDDTDDIFIYEFFHKKSESMPDGRYLMFLSEDIVLMDTPMPYRNLPIYRIAPADILGTSYGYTPMFDLLPIQDAVNSLHSTILTNQQAFGVQNIYVPRGADIATKSLEGGLNIIEGNSGAGKPEPLNLTQTPPEIFNYLKMLEQEMETISGVNSVARGNPEASLKTGTALALVQSMALQFISGLQQQYVQLVEDIGSGLINMLKDFAAVPRIAMISGKSNRTYVETMFSGVDLSQVNRVIVDMGNPMAQTTAGKLQIASDLLQYQLVKTPEQYISVLTTGQLNTITDDTQNSLILIKDENEKLMEGQEIPVMSVDQHLLHIKGHRGIFDDINFRMDDSINGPAFKHLEDHINALRQIDPGLLLAIGEQPIGPNPQEQPQQTDVNNSSAPNAPKGPIGEPNTVPPPREANLPKVDPSLLPNPDLQQQALGNVK